MTSSKVLDEVRTAMTEYYTVLTRMPHFPEDSLLLPPHEGWQDIDVETLRTQLGRSDAAIEFVRHLPCLKPCVGSERAWITPLSQAFAYHTGETWPNYIDQGIAPPTPPHLFYLSDSADSREGVMLCVDTEQGTIVELAGDLKEGVSWDDEDQMPNDQKWTAYRALPAKEFFHRETVRLLNLFYMPVPPAPSCNEPGEPIFFMRARNLAEEEAMLGIGDPSPREPSQPHDRETLRAYEIYKRNGWPEDNFNVERCRTELLEFAQELEDEIGNDEDEDDEEEDEEDDGEEEDEQ